MKRNFFNSHLIDAKISYIKHMTRAIKFGFKSLMAAKLFFIHSLFPFLFKESGGKIIKDINTNLEMFDRKLSQHIRRGAVAIVVDKNNKSLILKRSDSVGTFQRCWNFPSGAIDPEESEVEAAARECYEESGIKIKKEDMHFVTKFRDHNAEVDIYYFITNKYSGSVNINWESTEFLWLDIDSIFLDLSDSFVPVPKDLYSLVKNYDFI